MADRIEKPQPASTAVMAFPQPPLRNAEEYLKAYTGYAYTAISSISQEVASIDLHLFSTKYVHGEPEHTEVYEHELLSLLNYANPLTTFYDLAEATQIYLELTGESFWVVLKQGTTPKELWLVRPDWVRVVPSAKEVIDHYTYHPGGNINEGVDIPKENMIHFKYFHPMNPYRGKGSVQAAALPLDIHTFAQEYNRNFFFNSAVPSLVFTSDKAISDPVIKRFINQWQATYGGRSKSNKIAFLGNGLKIDKISVGGKEMDFTEQQRMMRDDILAVFKVPKTILGLTDDVNRANAEATTVAFMERVVTPRMRKLVGTLNEFLVPMFGDNNLFLDFTDPAPEDTDKKLKYYENALKYGWMTPNEVRNEENMEPIPGGDTPLPYIVNPLVPRPEEYTEDLPEEEPEETPEGDNEEGKPVPDEEVNEGKGVMAYLKKVFGRKELKKMINRKPRTLKKKAFKHMMKPPVKRMEVIKREKLEKDLTPVVMDFIGKLLANKEGNGVGIREEPKKDKPEILFTEEAKDAYWRQFIQTVTDKEEDLKETAVKLFREQEKLILENLEKEVKHWNRGVKKATAGSAVPSVADLSKIWTMVWSELIREIYIEQGNYVLAFLGTGANIDVTTAFAVEFLIRYGGQLIKDINTTTRKALVGTLSEGYGAGESVEDLSRRVRDVFKEATRVRALLIARTEAIRTSNYATVEAYRQSGVVVGKEWLTERDNRTCPYCNKMDGKVIGLDKNYFQTGDKVEVEGQTLTISNYPVPQPPLHPNCRCTTIPVLIETKPKQ